MKSLQIVGRKKSGKTSLVTRLLPLLRARGLRVGTVKHSRHPRSLDREGSDSRRHREAGAEVTIGITETEVSIHRPRPGDPTELEARIARETEGCDLVLIEGWSQRRGPKVEILAADEDGAPTAARHAGTGELVALVLGPAVRGASAHGQAPPCFGWDETEALADFVARWAAALTER